MGSEEDEVAKLTEEQRLHKRMDEQNLQIQILMQGDRENFPVRKLFSSSMIFEISFRRLLATLFVLNMFAL